MKQFRVTIRYNIDSGHVGSISVTVPAYSDTHAINRTIDANNLIGKVVASHAEPGN